MFRLLERYQTVLVLAVALALPLFVYRANATDPADARLVDRLIRGATAPIQGLLMSAVGAVSELWSSYVDVVDARRENGELRRRLHAAEQKNDELQAIAVENEHLRAVLELEAKNPAVESLPANVIGAGTSPSARTIDIDRGALDRVGRGMVVISDAGLVGIVLRVGWTSSEVLLVADEKLELSATVVRSRARARLKGGGLVPGFGLELSEISRSDDVRPGDRLATSGLGGVFPKGIPIGEIKQVRTPTGAAYRLADVEPFVDFGRLEHVIVLLAAPKEEPIVTPGALLPAAL
ncbi:rod shape-determining protein MreC, partial [Myxococcota bacterium]|nr:rod shape-determining protein MreC [Myxococcota bacterium]